MAVVFYLKEGVKCVSKNRRELMVSQHVVLLLLSMMHRGIATLITVYHPFNLKPASGS